MSNNFKFVSCASWLTCLLTNAPPKNVCHAAWVSVSLPFIRFLYWQNNMESTPTIFWSEKKYIFVWSFNWKQFFTVHLSNRKVYAVPVLKTAWAIWTCVHMCMEGRWTVLFSPADKDVCDYSWPSQVSLWSWVTAVPVLEPVYLCVQMCMYVY